MINTINAVPITPDALADPTPQAAPKTTPQHQTDGAVQPGGQAPAGDPAQATTPDVRLSIEENADHTGYVYRMVDQATGRVVSEIPREQATQLADDPTYIAGDLISTQA